MRAPLQPMSRRQHRAMNEAAICKTLQHPNIVATYAYDVHALTSAPVPGAGGAGAQPRSRMQGSGAVNSSNSGESKGGLLG